MYTIQAVRDMHEDVLRRFHLTHYGEAGLEHVRLFSVPKLWSSTNCGFGDGGGAAMTWAQSWVFIREEDWGSRTALVYHKERFAYRISDYDLNHLVEENLNFPGQNEVEDQQLCPFGMIHLDA